MIFDLLDELEKKIETAIDSITELQIRLDNVITQKNQALEENESLKTHNDQLVENYQQWQSRLSALVGKMDQVDEALEVDLEQGVHENKEHEEHEEHEEHKEHEHHD